MELTRSELQIMNKFWASDAPLSRSDLLEMGEEKTWKDSSVHILLNGLLKKGAIKEVGFVKRSKTYGRTFAPTMNREEYYVQAILAHRHPPRIVELVDALLRSEHLTEEDLKRIKALIKE